MLHLWESRRERSPRYLPVISGAVGGMAREPSEVAATQSGQITNAGTALAAEAGFDARPLSEGCEAWLWHGVLTAAAAHDASVIVLGTRGLSGLSAMLGSVSHGALHHAKRALLVVP